MKNIVVIGGGTGLSSMMMGMKKIKDVNLTAIVTVADDGGSTGASATCTMCRPWAISVMCCARCR